ncbi:MAG TPA: BRO family protein [bacterium]|nr:BRO family protein [bacterium]
MDKEIVVRLHTSFEEMARKFPNTGVDYWFARDLQMLLGYAKWENFAKVVDKAITACKTSGYDPKDHFLGIRKMVELGSGARREIDDIALTRYACYLIAQNGDPGKEQIAFAQTYVPEGRPVNNPGIHSWGREAARPRRPGWTGEPGHGAGKSALSPVPPGRKSLHGTAVPALKRRVINRLPLRGKQAPWQRGHRGDHTPACYAGCSVTAAQVRAEKTASAARTARCP